MDSGVFGYGYTCVIDLYKYIHYRAGGSLYALFLIVKDFLPKKKSVALNVTFIHSFLISTFTLKMHLIRLTVHKCPSPVIYSRVCLLTTSICKDPCVAPVLTKEGGSHRSLKFHPLPRSPTVKVCFPSLS